MSQAISRTAGQACLYLFLWISHSKSKCGPIILFILKLYRKFTENLKDSWGMTRVKWQVNHLTRKRQVVADILILTH